MEPVAKKMGKTGNHGIGMKKRDVKRGEEFIDFEFMEIGGSDGT
jgi:hypothetical protein